jgi:ABC-2 type transport system ATP-binding protein
VHCATQHSSRFSWARWVGVTATAPESCASLTGVTHRFGETIALRELTLAVYPGEVFALLGHNGAGKTTTVRILNGLLSPSAGEVRVFGRSPTTDGATVRRRTAVLTESFTLDERLTARETLFFAAEIYGVPSGEVGGRVGELLATFDLAGRGDDRVATFSKGMKQRLSLGRALVHRPDLVFLDEPSAGLDPVATRELHAIVRRLSREEGRTIILCTHNLAEAQELSDRVAVLAHGALLAIGTPAELAAHLAPRRELLIEVDAAQTQRALGILASVDGIAADVERHGVIRVRRAQRDLAPLIAARLVTEGVSLFRLEPVEPTLADAYFALQAMPEGVS